MLLLGCAPFDKVYINSYEGGGEKYMSEPVIWGYARVSSTTQHLDRQLEQLRAYGIDERHIKTEKLSGKDLSALSSYPLSEQTQ